MRLLYEVPWWLPVAIGLAAIVLGWTANNRQEKRLGLIAGSLLVLALILAVLSYFLESPRQQVIRLSRQLVATVANHDWPAMRSLLHNDISIITWRGPAEVSNGAAVYHQRFGIQGAWISSIQAEGSTPEITVTMRVVANLRESPGFPSDWRLLWQKDGEQWLLRVIDPLGSPAVPTGSLDGYFKGKP